MAITAQELDDMTNVDIESKLREHKEELFNLRFQSATGQLESHGRLRIVRRDIARIYTIVRERELGIRQSPGAESTDAGTETDTGTGAETGTDTGTADGGVS